MSLRYQCGMSAVTLSMRLRPDVVRTLLKRPFPTKPRLQFYPLFEVLDGLQGHPKGSADMIRHPSHKYAELIRVDQEIEDDSQWT